MPVVRYMNDAMSHSALHTPLTQLLGCVCVWMHVYVCVYVLIGSHHQLRKLNARIDLIRNATAKVPYLGTRMRVIESLKFYWLVHVRYL